MFEIFLNESRKCEISYGNVSELDREHSKLVETNKYIRGQKRRGSNMNIRAEELPSPNMRKRGISVAASSKEKALSNVEVQKRHVTLIESSCIFCLIWTVAMFYRSEFRSSIGSVLLEKIKNYFKASKALDSDSPASFIKVFRLKAKEKKEMPSNKLTIFDYCFDIRQQKWVPWSELKIPEHQIITNDFKKILIPTEEKARFNNTLLVDSARRKNLAENRELLSKKLPISENFFYVETTTSKIMRFFMDYMLAYKKPFYAVSEY